MSWRSVSGGLALAWAVVTADLAAQSLPFNLARLRVGSDSFALMIQGVELGALRDSVESTATGFRYRQSTRIPGLAEQDTHIELDSSWAPTRLRQTGVVDGEETTIDVAFGLGRAKGTATTGRSDADRRRVEIDTTVVDAVEENLLQRLVPTLPWTPAAAFAFSVFSSSSGETHAATLEVIGAGLVESPAGTAECLIVEYAGGPATVRFHVTTAPSHDILRIDFVGTPVHLLRVR